jgi:hypothetical protein
LKIKKNARQHDNGKKTIMAINTTLSSFLNIEHTREIRERKENIFYINPSFLKLLFSYHSKSLIENQSLLNIL